MMQAIQYWEDFQRHWEAFQQQPYADLIMIAFGGLLLLIGVLKIIRSSLKMLFWVILSAIGIASIAHGMDESPFELANGTTDDLTGYVVAGKELSADVLQLMCSKLDEASAILPDSTPQ
jgi:fatty-acid desaturase